VGEILGVESVTWLVISYQILCCVYDRMVYYSVIPFVGIALTVVLPCIKCFEKLPSVFEGHLIFF
jgi:hypothetical protein